jgi:hypothetical protein
MVTDIKGNPISPILEDGTVRLSSNTGNQLPTYLCNIPRGAKTSTITWQTPDILQLCFTWLSPTHFNQAWSLSGSSYIFERELMTPA